jgi:hypothetical protein
MAESLEWVSLAMRCRSLADEIADDAAAKSLNRLATQYETKARAHEFLQQVYSTNSSQTKATRGNSNKNQLAR